MLAVISALAAGLVGAAPAAATYPGENGKIYFTANAADSSAPDIWSVNPDGSELVNLTDLAGGAGEGYDPSVSGTGADVAFGTGSQATAEIWTMNADGSSPQQVTDDDLIDEQPAVSPDGSRIVFTNWTSALARDTWAMNFDGSGQVALVDSTLLEQWPTFTPDGETIALAYETGGNNWDIATSRRRAARSTPSPR